MTEDVVALPHPSPLTAMHMLVAPRRHVADFYGLDVAEQRHIWEIIGLLRGRVSGTLAVEGFDVGFQDGNDDDVDAHVVVHLVPRLEGIKLKLPQNVEWVNLDS